MSEIPEDLVLPDLPDTAIPDIPDLPEDLVLPELPELPSPTASDTVAPQGPSQEYIDKFGREGNFSQALGLPLNAALTGLNEAAITQQKGGGHGPQLASLIEGAAAGAKKQKATTIEDLMKTMGGLQESGQTLLPIYKDIGTPDGEFDVGDVPDAIRNFVISAGVDPLSYVAGPVLGAAGKGVSKTAQAVSKVLPDKSVAKVLASKVTPGVGTAAATGGLIGAATTKSDEDTLDLLANTAKGATLLGGIGVAGKPAADFARKVTDSAADSLATWLKGEKFSGISKAKELANAGKDKIRAAYVDMIQNYAEKFTGIKPDAQLAAAKVNETLKTEFIKRREFALMQFGDNPVPATFRNRLDEKIAADMHADGTVAKALEGQAEETVRAYNATKEFNDDMVKKINRDIYGQESGQWNKRTGQGIAGIPFHIEDLRPLESLKTLDGAFQTAKNVGPLKMARSLERGKSRDVLGAVESKELYIKRMAANWASQEERKAIQLMAEYASAPGVTAGKQAINKVLGTFDRASSFMKFNMLGPSTSWLRNNYPDNVTKAWHQVGLLGAMDAASMGAFRKGLWSDIGQIMKGDLTKPVKNAYTKDMAKLGVLETNLRTDVDLATEGASYYLSPDILAKKLADKPSLLAKAVMAPYNMTVKQFGNAVMHVGSRMENSARATTFIRAMEHIKKDKALYAALGDDGAKRVAADIVKKTFFDYADVSEFERMFAKRMIPFYTFFKKNAQYYANQISNPNMLGRIAAGDRVREYYGQGPSAEPLTKKQERQMPDYLQRGVPMSLGEHEGRLKVMFSPSSSLMDAYSALAPNAGNLLVEKANPIVKTPIEFYKDYDTFTKDEMFPSSLKGEKPLFSSGFTHLAIKEAIDDAIPPGPLRDLAETAAGVYGVKLDNKNPVSTDDMQVIIDRLSPLGVNSIIWPKPLLKQYYGSKGRLEEGKVSAEDLINNIWNTNQITTLSKKQRQYEEKRNKREEKKK